MCDNNGVDRKETWILLIPTAIPVMAKKTSSPWPNSRFIATKFERIDQEVHGVHHPRFNVMEGNDVRTAAVPSLFVWRSHAKWIYIYMYSTVWIKYTHTRCLQKDERKKNCKGKVIYRPRGKKWLIEFNPKRVCKYFQLFSVFFCPFRLFDNKPIDKSINPLLATALLLSKFGISRCQLISIYGCVLNWRDSSYSCLSFFFAGLFDSTSFLLFKIITSSSISRTVGIGSRMFFHPCLSSSVQL